VSLRWRGQWPATSAWEGGLEAVLAVHGHSGATEVRWLTDPALLEADGTKGDSLATGLRVPTASIDGLCARCGQAWPCLSCGP
jgi:hypothetical protein